MFLVPLFANNFCFHKTMENLQMNQKWKKWKKGKGNLLCSVLYWLVPCGLFFFFLTFSSFHHGKGVFVLFSLSFSTICYIGLFSMGFSYAQIDIIYSIFDFRLYFFFSLVCICKRIELLGWIDGVSFVKLSIGWLI